MKFNENPASKSQADGQTDRHDNPKWELLFQISWMYLKIN